MINSRKNLSCPEQKIKEHCQPDASPGSAMICPVFEQTASQIRVIPILTWGQERGFQVLMEPSVKSKKKGGYLYKEILISQRAKNNNMMLQILNFVESWWRKKALPTWGGCFLPIQTGRAFSFAHGVSKYGLLFRRKVWYTKDPSINICFLYIWNLVTVQSVPRIYCEVRGIKVQ